MGERRVEDDGDRRAEEHHRRPEEAEEGPLCCRAAPRQFEHPREPDGHEDGAGVHAGDVIGGVVADAVVAAVRHVAEQEHEEEERRAPGAAEEEVEPGEEHHRALGEVLPVEHRRHHLEARQVPGEVQAVHEALVLLAGEVVVERLPVVGIAPGHAGGVPVGPDQEAVAEEGDEADEARDREPPPALEAPVCGDPGADEARRPHRRVGEPGHEERGPAHQEVHERRREHVDHGHVVGEPDAHRQRCAQHVTGAPGDLEADPGVTRPRHEEEVERVHLGDAHLLPDEGGDAQHEAGGEAADLGVHRLAGAGLLLPEQGELAGGVGGEDGGGGAAEGVEDLDLDADQERQREQLAERVADEDEDRVARGVRHAERDDGGDQLGAVGEGDAARERGEVKKEEPHAEQRVAPPGHQAPFPLPAAGRRTGGLRGVGCWRAWSSSWLTSLSISTVSAAEVTGVSLAPERPSTLNTGTGSGRLGRAAPATCSGTRRTRHRGRARAR